MSPALLADVSFQCRKEIGDVFICCGLIKLEFGSTFIFFGVILIFVSYHIINQKKDGGKKLHQNQN